MARDAELDRLKVAQDVAFQRKQNAYQAQQTAWEKLSSARDEMNRAYEAKQRAYYTQDQAWQYYQSVKSHNGPRIDWLNSQQEHAFQNMKQAFENASSAYERRDGASASMYAAEGHRYKEESKTYVYERRRLVEEIRSARDKFQECKPAFQNAKDYFSSTEDIFKSAKAEHKRAQAEFKKAKAEFDACVKAFKTRLEQVRASGKKRREDKKSIAAKAGVPFQYRDNVWISKDSDGNTNIYFGGVGKPDGPGHGHYVMDQHGTVTYRRDPFDPHGAQNFEENRREEATLRIAQIAINKWAKFKWAKSQEGPRVLQSEDSDFKTLVKSGYDRDYSAIVSDIVIIDRHNKKEHYHIVIDEHGNELFSEWRANPTKKKKS
jgi:hypothetical protein cdiviTM7_02549